MKPSNENYWRINSGKQTTETIICETQAREQDVQEKCSSEEEHKVNALASGADEGRD